MRQIPDEFCHGPFRSADFTAAGFSEKVLRGQRFRRLYPRVWVHVDHELTEADRVTAARLALPPDARLTGVSRIRQLGLDVGASEPLQFVIGRELHLALDGIMLHRTDRLPPCDEAGVRPVAAFVEFCRDATVIDAIAVGDWLLHHGHMTAPELAELVLQERWRAGADQARWISRYLHPGARSLPESAMRAGLVFAGLPWPEVNVELRVRGRLVAVGDLAYRRWRAVAEYEGRHHQTLRSQYLRDVERYGEFRALDVDYVQVTAEMGAASIRAVAAVHAMLLRNGYDGPAPAFGAQWRMLFGRIRPSADGPPGRPAELSRPWAVAQRPSAVS